MDKLLKLWVKTSKDYKNKTKIILKRLQPLLAKISQNKLEETLDKASKSKVVWNSFLTLTRWDNWELRGHCQFYFAAVRLTTGWTRQSLYRCRIRAWIWNWNGARITWFWRICYFRQQRKQRMIICYTFCHCLNWTSSRLNANTLYF